MQASPGATGASPTAFQRRSQLYRRHLDLDAAFADYEGVLAVAAYADPRVERDLAERLGLADLSTWPRSGCAGPNAPQWLADAGRQPPNRPNKAVAQEDGGLIARLSEQEFLILQGLEADPGLFAALQDNWPSDAAESVHPLPHADSHCWLALSGALASEALAKLCAVDLSSRSFGLCDVAQTSLARVNAIILRQDLGATPCFHILSDASSAEYLWDVLVDAMREFGGAPVGLEALRTLKLRDRPSESFSPTERHPRIQPRKAPKADKLASMHRTLAKVAKRRIIFPHQV